MFDSARTILEYENHHFTRCQCGEKGTVCMDAPSELCSRLYGNLAVAAHVSGVLYSGYLYATEYCYAPRANSNGGKRVKGSNELLGEILVGKVVEVGCRKRLGQK